MTPKTVEGQVATIVYCIIGLPLTLMCVAKLGQAFACAFRVIYHTCCCAICCFACIMKRKEDKHHVPGSDMNDALGVLVIGPDDKKATRPSSKNGNRVNTYTPFKIWKRNVIIKFKRSLRHDTAVPTYLCLLVMAAYITGGAYFFSIWEPTWRFREAAYFCFVTLTTIGFGDFVPGVDKMGGTSTSNTNLVLCALYLLVGLALIGMCIDLMQVDVVKKCKWIMQKIGLSKPKHAKTVSDKKKERVGLKLSCETLPQNLPGSISIYSNNNHRPITRSTSHSLEVPSTSSAHSYTTRKCVSMPTTPSIPAKSMPSRHPVFASFLPLATSEESSVSDSTSNNTIDMSKINTHNKKVADIV